MTRVNGHGQHGQLSEGQRGAQIIFLADNLLSRPEITVP